MADNDQQAPADVKPAAAAPAEARPIPLALDEAGAKLIAQELFKLQQEAAAKAAPAAPSTLPVPAEDAQKALSPAVRFLAKVMKIPTTELVTEIDKKVTEKGITWGIGTAVTLTVGAINPHDPAAAVLAGAVAKEVAEMTSGALAKSGVAMVNGWLEKGREKLLGTGHKDASLGDAVPAVTPAAPEALPAPSPEIAAREADTPNLTEMPKPAEQQPVRQVARLKNPAA